MLWSNEQVNEQVHMCLLSKSIKGTSIPPCHDMPIYNIVFAECGVNCFFAACSWCYLSRYLCRAGMKGATRAPDPSGSLSKTWRKGNQAATTASVSEPGWGASSFISKPVTRNKRAVIPGCSNPCGGGRRNSATHWTRNGATANDQVNLPQK